MSGYPWGSTGFWVEALTRDFASAGLPDPVWDARSLVCAAARASALDLTLRPERPVSADAQETLRLWRERRLAGEPITRILGSRGFWSFELTVAPGVLDPRPDSEVLVEACLRRLGADARGKPLRLLDAGTGSGALVAALLTELPMANAVALDIAPEAATLAISNLTRLGLTDRCEVRMGAWDDVPECETFDVVVSNPPYIRSGDIDELAAEVRLHDPRLALDGGPDGLDAYRALGRLTPRWLRRGGVAAFEIGATQGSDVTKILSAAGLQRLEIIQDFSELDRVVVGEAS